MAGWDEGRRKAAAAGHRLLDGVVLRTLTPTTADLQRHVDTERVLAPGWTNDFGILPPDPDAELERDPPDECSGPDEPTRSAAAPC